MSDFRENVLPVVFNSLFSEKNDTDNIRNNVEAIKQNQLLKIQVIPPTLRQQTIHNSLKVAKSNDIFSKFSYCLNLNGLLVTESINF